MEERRNDKAEDSNHDENRVKYEYDKLGEYLTHKGAQVHLRQADTEREIHGRWGSPNDQVGPLR